MRNNKGVTLIALAITIIVLLILASITIGSVRDKKGIVKQAESSSAEAEKESIIEKIEADLYNEKIKTGKKPTKSELKDMIEANGYSETLAEDSFTSKGGKYTINYDEILGWEDKYAEKQLILHLDAINNIGEGDKKHSTTSNIWKNLAGNNNNGVITGAVWNENNLSLDGQDDWINLGRFMDKHKMTVETTVMLRNIQTGNRDIIGNWDAGGYGIYINSAKAISAIWVQGNSDYTRINPNYNLELNKIYNISTTYDGNTYKMFINGEKKEEKAITGKIKNPANNTIMAIGADPSGEKAMGEFLDMNVYSTRIYDRALTEKEVKNNYEIDKARFGI